MTQPGEQDLTVPSRFLFDDATLTSWQGYLWALADRLRCEVVNDPGLLDVLLAPPHTVPRLYPPLSDMALVEEFLATLRRHRFTDEQAAAAYLSFFWCVLGLLRVNIICAAADPVGSHGRGDGANSPVVDRLQRCLSEDHSQQQYEEAVEALLDRLEQTLLS